MQATDDNRQKTCEERIAGELAGELETMRDALERMQSDDEDEREEAIDERDNRPLEIATKRVVKILLSTGGPADWFEVTVDEDGEPTRVEYVFQDWFDGARCDVRDAERDLVLEYLMPFVEIATQEV